jgi:hypothetical protein
MNGLEQHAVLTALLAKHACLHCWRTGEEAFISGIKRLGIERGTRMAARALSMGEKLDIVTFLPLASGKPIKE